MSEDSTRPPEPVRDDAGAAPRAHRPWSTVLLAFHMLGVSVAAGLLLLALVAGTGVLPGDLGSPDAVGNAFFLLFGVILAAVYAPLAWFTVRGRRQADRGSTRTLHGLAIVACLLGTIEVVAGLLTLRSVLDVVGPLLAGVYLFAAARTVRATL
ncbi:hypothetical protein [Actinotalea sp. K2]|uniref:hypothetical protein n=1 Tax=Actinotalea sp. K2 TaxID=2939438 RepID=UPI002016F9E6|nr:hypothetical protein [Actinotalea sp. K2]MCL3861593.1 hypothetical protein [Actinotalea sp. K2]